MPAGAVIFDMWFCLGWNAHGRKFLQTFLISYLYLFIFIFIYLLAHVIVNECKSLEYFYLLFQIYIAEPETAFLRHVDACNIISHTKSLFPLFSKRLEICLKNVIVKSLFVNSYGELKLVSAVFVTMISIAPIKTFLWCNFWLELSNCLAKIIQCTCVWFQWPSMRGYSRVMHK